MFCDLPGAQLRFTQQQSFSPVHSFEAYSCRAVSFIFVFFSTAARRVYFPPQPRSFYSACDELGLMIWQDLPYACALYPVQEPESHSPADESGYDSLENPRNPVEKSGNLAKKSDFPIKDSESDSREKGSDEIESGVEGGRTVDTSEDGRVEGELAGSTADGPKGGLGHGLGAALEGRVREKLGGQPGNGRREEGRAGGLGNGLLESAAEEAKAVVRRLSSHASVVCWGGNNEVCGMWRWTRPRPPRTGNLFVCLFISSAVRAVNSEETLLVPRGKNTCTSKPPAPVV